jgi:hypothetical protein
MPHLPPHTSPPLTASSPQAESNPRSSAPAKFILATASRARLAPLLPFIPLLFRPRAYYVLDTNLLTNTAALHILFMIYELLVLQLGRVVKVLERSGVRDGVV